METTPASSGDGTNSSPNMTSPNTIEVAAASNATTQIAQATAPGGPSPTAGEGQQSSKPHPQPQTKLRSCVTCRKRKVRCDKTNPCSNCHRAQIPCVFPLDNKDKPPRWARRLERVAISARDAQAQGLSPGQAQGQGLASQTDPGVSQVMSRLRGLESLVKELSGQLEQAHAAAASGAGTGAPGSTRGSSPSMHSPGSSGFGRDGDPAGGEDGVHKQFGRLVLGDGNKSRYVSSGFWSRVNDELQGLKMDTDRLAGGQFDDSSDDEDSPEQVYQEMDRPPTERHAFLFGHNLSPSAGGAAADLREFHPLPSQIPFFLAIFRENVNLLSQAVHIPTVEKMLRDLRGKPMSELGPANEALMFSIYYASIASMDEDDITLNFGASKAELIMKFRIGLEYALAKADFLNVPDITLVQAFAIFLLLARLHDSPRFVWMMTGLLIRMAHALGLHRDGSRFPNLTPYQVEMRRRIWWVVCMLDARSSEDQGADLTITHGSFDTRMPLCINDGDISPDTKEMPLEHEGITDMTFMLVSCGWCDVGRKMMPSTMNDRPPTQEEQDRLLSEFFEVIDRQYLRFPEARENIAYWVTQIINRLVMAKMTLLIHLPSMFSSNSERFSAELRHKLLVAAVEVAEHNHALNEETAARHWRWIYQTYTHWHSVVYILMEATKRPWSPLVERAWIALHSIWLIPAQAKVDKGNRRIWVPLKQLMAKTRLYRRRELQRLRADAQAAEWVERQDRESLQPTSQGPYLGEDSAEAARQKWRELVGLPTVPVTLANGYVLPRADEAMAMDTSGFQMSQGLGGVSGPDMTYGTTPSQPQPDSNIPQQGGASFHHSPDIMGGYKQTQSRYVDPAAVSITSSAAQPSTTTSASSFPPPSTLPEGWTGAGLASWLWADADPAVDVFGGINVNEVPLDVDMDVDGMVDWNSWMESAKGQEMFGG